MVRKILHLDLDAFFCAVEEQHHPELRGKAFAVGGQPDRRGVVASCSYPARKFGVRSAMPMAQAVRLCPDLIIVQQHYSRYQEASREVMGRLRQLTPLVEQLSIDEAFLDVSLLPQPAETIARELQAKINDELALPCSLGIATNKLVAKIANNVGKANSTRQGTPNAIQLVPPGQEAAFLAPLDMLELWGVGPKTAERLRLLGMHTIGDIAAFPTEELVRLLGKHGEGLSQHAKGIDTRPVFTEHEAKSISKETTFDRDISDFQTIKRTLRRLSDGVGRQVRKSSMSGTTVKIKIRWADFTTLTRQITLEYATDQDDDIYHAAESLLEQTWPPGKPVRLIGVGISGFEKRVQQLGLWEDQEARQQQQRLQSTLDDLRNRFGDGSIRRGSSLPRGQEDTDNTD